MIGGLVCGQEGEVGWGGIVCRAGVSVRVGGLGPQDELEKASGVWLFNPPCFLSLGPPVLNGGTDNVGSTFDENMW